METTPNAVYVDPTNVTSDSFPMIVVSDWKHVQDSFYIVGYIFTPIVLLVGVFGNSMTILTVSSKCFSDLTSRYILIALAISDTTLIVLQPFNKLFVRQLFGQDIRALSDGGCKLFFWLFRTAKMTSSWLIVILCFERFVAVVFPLKTKSIVNIKSIIFLICCDYVIIGIYNGIWTFSSIIQGGICKPDVVYPDTKIKYRNFMLGGLSLYSFIPMSLMVIFTPVIVFKLIQKRKNRQNTQRTGYVHVKKDSKEIRASLVLVVVVMAFILLVLPITLVFCFAYFQSVSAFEMNSMGFFVYRELSQMLELINYSINFFLYIMCSDMFRKRALQLIRRSICVSKVFPSPPEFDPNNSTSNQNGTSARDRSDNSSAMTRSTAIALPTVSI